jgi:3-hydroxyisobutyrate dehydrogenase-like beta-hydroxyacid dehydrogenase
VAASTGDLANAANVLILCLPDSAVTATLIDDLARPGLLVIDTTTGTPSEMASFGQMLHQAGAHYLDCTIAASSVQVRNGEATAMVGGEPEHFQRASPVLASFCQKTFHVGPWGAGARMKLVVNLALGLQRAVLGETLGFAEACGIDQALALEILKASPAYAKAMDMKGARMLEARYTAPDARLRQHHKDVRLILQEGDRNEAKLPLSKLHETLLEQAEAQGWSDLDNSVVRELFRSIKMA